ncbi:hypothetical protein FACS1894187_20370 [Synergistales bacterium]|nr:hypothetical protein FACS1894187_20370 [Synergistales bacterium]
MIKNISFKYFNFGLFISTRSIRSAVFFLALVWASAASGADSPMADFEERRRAVAANMEAATVWIVIEKSNSWSTGSGFIVADGFIVTNAHVVDGLKGGEVIRVLNEHIPACEAELVDMLYDRFDNGRDFALLRFDPPGGVELPVLSFSFDVQRMDRVSAWGYPTMATKFDASVERLDYRDFNALEPAPLVYTEGTVNTIVDNRAGVAILHSAAISGGNSGGPLVNSRGEVVGMNTWGYKEEKQGAFLNGAQLASEIVSFLIVNNITPNLASEPQMANAGASENTTTRRRRGAEESEGNEGRKGRKRRKGSEGSEEKEGSKGKEGSEGSERRVRNVGDYSLVIPRGWSVLDEGEDIILAGADDNTVSVGVMTADREGRDLAQIARDLSKEFNGGEPELDDDIYKFIFSDDGVDTLICVGEADDDEKYVMVFVTGDGDNPGVEEMLNGAN